MLEMLDGVALLGIDSGAGNSAATLTVWTKTNGTWFNVLTVLLGTSIGLFCRNRFPPTFQQVITQAVGLCVVFLGMTMAGNLLKVQVGRVDGLILGLLALVLGGLLGEALRLEDRLQQMGDALRAKLRGGARFTEGFVTATLLFCVGPMAIVGCLNNGLAGNNDLLVVKSIMDGISSIAFSSIYGLGVGFSVIPILIYQGSLSLAAGMLATTLVDPATDPQILLVTGVGGLMVLGIGINLLDMQKIRVSAFLPALVIAPIMLFAVKLIH